MVLEWPGRRASPADAAVKGDWWDDFGDPALNALEERVDVSNQTVQQAARAVPAGAGAHRAEPRGRIRRPSP